MKDDNYFSVSTRSRLLRKREKYLGRNSCKSAKSRNLCASCQYRSACPESSVISSRLHSLRPRSHRNDSNYSVTSDYSSCSSLSSQDSLAYRQFIPQKNSKDDADDNDSSSDSQICTDFCDSDFESDRCEDTEYSRDTRNTRMLRNKGITVIIPEQNKSGYNRDDFCLGIIEEAMYVPDIDYCTVHACKVVSVEPHGASFFESQPALIYLPLSRRVSSDDNVICLCSNTPEGISPQWEDLPAENYTIRGNRVIIRALHFSLFTVVIERPYPEVHRIIDRHGGTLTVPSIPGLEINFPADSCPREINAVLQARCNEAASHHDELALASPIIMAGPHGYQFNPESEPVTVSLPIPDYKLIRRCFGSKKAKLSIWESTTNEYEPLVWEKAQIDFEVHRDLYGNVCVRFQVSHFSFFKAMWDILASSLYEAKLGVAYFYPYISFSMMCQAFMEEDKDTQCFGLEVICYRSDNKWPEITNYKYRVGSSLKPKLVKPGIIVIRLKSELFEANVEAGEDSSLIKEERDFRGREFEKQFACRFKQTPGVNRGAFGKVVVERAVSSGHPELLFEFNLNKSGKETEEVKHESSERWSAVAIKELAGTLHITEDNNWKRFARHIGFTKNEINSKLQHSGDPFFSMVNLYQERGGTPEEFVQALYEVSRNLQLHSRSPSNASTSSGGSNQSYRERFLNLSLTPKKWQDIDDSDNTSDNTSLPSRKRPSHSSSQSSSKKRRRRFSDVSETMSSSEESTCTDDHKTDTRKLSDTDMWKISELMNTMNWRALGRTLGLEESILLNIEHAYKTTGFRECAYQMLLEWKGRQPIKCTFGTLYSALSKENMNAVAKQMKLKLSEA